MLLNKSRLINREIFRLAIPNIISNISVPLIGAVDTALMGHQTSVHYLGAIAITSMIFNSLYWSFIFLRMGTTGITAQAFGREDHNLIQSTLFRSIFIAVILSSLCILFQIPIFYFATIFIDSSDLITSLSRQYFVIRIWDAPATLILFSIHGWFLGMQNVRFPMYSTILINSLNLLLSLFFVKGLGLSISGVAFGSLISQYIGLFFTIWLMRKYYPTYHLAFYKFMNNLLQRVELRRFLKINFHIFIRTISLIVAFAFFTIQSAKSGEEILGINNILLQFYIFYAYAVDGFAYAAESIIGKYIGKKDKATTQLAVRYLLVWGFLTGCIYTYFLNQNSLVILRIFTRHQDIISLGQDYLPWLIATCLVGSLAFIWDGIFSGATATKPMRDTVVFSTFFVYIPLYYLTYTSYPDQAIWFSFFAFMLMRGALLTYYSNRNIYQNSGLI